MYLIKGRGERAIKRIKNNYDIKIIQIIIIENHNIYNENLNKKN